MDINHQKWDPYNMSMEEQHILDDHHHQIHQTPFDHTQWSNYNINPLQVQVHDHHPEHPNSAPNLDHQAWNLKLVEDQLQEGEEGPEEELGAMKEMMFKIASMQPVDIDPATIRRPKRRNVRISDDPQSVAARHRRERISEKIRILQRLVPGGTKMDTASMLDEAIRYVKFLKRQIRLLQSNPYPPPPSTAVVPAVPEDWAGTSYVFGGNNVINDGGDDAMCFNPKFIGHH